MEYLAALPTEDGGAAEEAAKVQPVADQAMIDAAIPDDALASFGDWKDDSGDEAQPKETGTHRKALKSAAKKKDSAPSAAGKTTAAAVRTKARADAASSVAETDELNADVASPKQRPLLDSATARSGSKAVTSKPKPKGKRALAT